MPCTWTDLPPVQCGNRLRLSRRFHRPTGITPDVRVWLVVKDGAPGAEILLNGTRLSFAMVAPVTVDITDQLRDENEVVILTVDQRKGTGKPDTSGPFSEVCLEIREKHAP
jgi:hypothetical protein